MTRQANPTGMARVDGLYEDYGLIVELDGRRYHAGIAATGDAARDNVHLLAGFVTLRFTWQQVTADPCGVARQVAAVLQRAGWNDPMRRCGRCPRH